jgi:glutaryl-CoA dehydrogenase
MAEMVRTTTPALDYYRLDDLLTPEEREIRYRVRDFMETEIVPYINPYWERGEFPRELFAKLAKLNLAGGMIQGYECPGLSALATGLVGMEFARTDGSIGTMYGVHSGLAMGSIWLCGSEEQRQKYLPPMARMELLGCFGLTEPTGGSDASHPASTARREGDKWILNGQKRWIGLADEADIIIFWARNEETNQVNGFIVPTDTPGYSATPIEGKISKRALINCDVTLTNVEIPLENKLANANSFRDTAKVLGMTRVGVAWEAVGAAMAAYEIALDYAKKRTQFGKPIAGFQLIQDKLVRMLGNITAMTFSTLRLTQLQQQGIMTDGQASLAKFFNTTQGREVVAMGREILGGNGILLENHVARHFADFEAIYSYEGTAQVQTLVVGREITGLNAIV